MEQKKGIKTVVLIISLIIVLILATIGGFFYKQYDKLENKKTTSTIIRETTKAIKNEIALDKVKEYLSFIPFYNSTPIEDIIDAYGKSQTINEIKPDILIYMAISNLTPVEKNDNLPKVSGGLCGEGEDCDGDEYFNKVEVDDNLLKYYGKSDIITKDSIVIPGGYLVKADNYYATMMGAGSTPINKVNKVINTKQEDDTIIIEEKVLFYTESMENIDKVNIYKLSSDAVYETNIIDSIKNNETNINNYLQNNISLLNTFKHTFKLNDNGNYTWYSTEIE